MTRTQKIDLAVFAHNEEYNIFAVLTMLDRQDIFDHAMFSIRVLVLANGCSDETVQMAEKAVSGLTHAQSFTVCNITAGGKSRTWNEFVHNLARSDADLLIFCDADIDIPQTDVVHSLAVFLNSNPECVVASSRPVKDIVHAPEKLNFLDKLIAAAGGTLDDWRKSICGQLYILRADVAQGLHLPIGLPVEDGFVRALVLTDVFRQPENLNLIDGDDSIFHVYESERSVISLIRHQVRIVVGGAVNAVVFDLLNRSGRPHVLLKEASQDPDWVSRVCQNTLPRRYGYVPSHFLTKRLYNFWKATGLRPKCIILIGFGFDILVYVIAQIKMARGTGAGYW